ncbi:uncharacterized protein LOC133205176 [Saccostrea echinata]|uniref:uncharacterized protein LOC133205176 n=1 Tax=Saccostrea echinata TaxID=191078 RepID=UPI002A802AC4|nr:uncharacterized protein LOC133205176 [Saccostrea echinata]
MFSRVIIKRSVIAKGCNIRLCRSLRESPSKKIEENTKDSDKSVELSGSECDDYLGVNLSILEHVEDKVVSEEIQNEQTKEELSRTYGIGVYTKPHAYDSQVLETNFGSIKVDRVRKGLIPLKKDFSNLKPTLGSIADTLINYRKKVDKKISPHSVSQLLLNQKEHDDENDSSINKTTKLENQDQHKNGTELQSGTTNMLETTMPHHKTSKHVQEITVEGNETLGFQVPMHQGPSNLTHKESDQLLTQAEGVNEEITTKEDLDTISTISKSIYEKPVFDKLHQVHEQRILQMNASDTAKNTEVKKISVGTETLSLNGKSTKERNAKFASKHLKGLLREDVTLSETNLHCRTSESEKLLSKSTLEQVVKIGPLKHPGDGFLESCENRIDQPLPLMLEKETDISQEMGNSVPERVVPMSELNSCQETPMVENAAYKYFLDLQRQEEVPTIDKKSTANLSKYLPKNLDKLTEEEVLEELMENVIYNRDDILAINKIYGIPSQGGEGVRLNIADLLPKLAERIQCKELHMVHRLDKETTGIMLFGKTEEMANKLRKAFKKREVKKTYLVITKGIPSLKEGIIDVPIMEGEVGKDKRKRMTCIPVYDSETKHVMHKTKKKLMPAITHYKVVANSNSCALLEVSPETGVKHQIRTHLFHVLNTPLLGDHKYSYLTEIKPQILPSDVVQRLEIRQSKARNLPMYIHAKFIMIPEFLDGRSFSVHCSVPRAFRSFLKKVKISHKNVDEHV